jgi:hypothetical protein
MSIMIPNQPDILEFPENDESEKGELE